MRRLLPDSIAGWVILVVITGLVASQAVRHRHSLRQPARGADHSGECPHRRTGGHADAFDRPHLARTAPGHRAQRQPSLPHRHLGAEQRGRCRRCRATEDSVADRGDRRPAGESGPAQHPGGLHRRLRWTCRSMATSSIRCSATSTQELRGTLRQALGQQLAGPTFVISLQLADSTWLNFAAADRATVPAWSHQSVALIAAMLIAVIALSVLGIRRLTAPLGTLAQAAERLGRDVNAPPLAGARSIRRPQGAARLQQHAGAHPALRRGPHAHDRRHFPRSAHADHAAAPARRIHRRFRAAGQDAGRSRRHGDHDPVDAQLRARGGQPGTAARRRSGRPLAQRVRRPRRTSNSRSSPRAPKPCSAGTTGGASPRLLQSDRQRPQIWRTRARLPVDRRRTASP